MVETWGRGIEKMITVCKKHGVSKPIFSGETTGLWVEFKNHDAEMRKKLEETKILEKNPLKTKEIGILKEIEKRMSLKMSVKVSVKMLELLILNPKITIPKLAKEIDKSERTVNRILKKLQKEGYLKRVGPDKGGYWEVIQNEK